MNTGTSNTEREIIFSQAVYSENEYLEIAIHTVRRQFTQSREYYTEYFINHTVA